MPNHIDNILIQVRGLLQERGVKLWLPPFYVQEVGSCEIQLENLATDFSSCLGLAGEHCLLALKELQSGALQKLSAREEFQKTGIAAIKVKVLNTSNSPTINVNLRLDGKGTDLLQKIGEATSINWSSLKVIFSGKVLELDKTLNEQGITNNQQIMALSLKPVKGNKNDEIYDRVRKAREDAALVLEAKSQTFLRMEDQDGNAVHLPPNERKKILMALALHEKGRSAMKREDYNEALILFLEADEEFSSASSRLLESVDNYALLNLDIVWCYLCLQSMSYLPDAQRRLNICEENFRRSYGRNLDRVVSVKGGSENERALIMRLHLLQGVVSFHQNKRSEAKRKLEIAESELRNLKVDDMAVVSLMEMGYSLAETRVALRASKNNIDRAVQHIMDRRERKSKARKRAKLERKLEKNSDREDGWVNPRTAQNLIQMGFQPEYVFAALRRTDNDVHCAIDFLNNRRNELVPERLNDVKVDQSLVDTVVKMGFDPDTAKIALELAMNNSDLAIDMLLKSQSDGNEFVKTQKLISDTIASNESNIPSTSSTNQGDVTVTSITERLEKEVSAIKAYDRLAQDLNEEDDEYLDITLDQEEQILHQYMKYLQ